MKKTVMLALVSLTSLSLQPADSFSSRFGGSQTEPTTVQTSQPTTRSTGTGPDSFGSRFGGNKQDASSIHPMTGEADPAAKQALKQGGPIGLARYMIRKIADALGYNTQEMIDLVQSAMSGHGTSKLPPVKSSKKKAAPAPVRTSQPSMGFAGRF